MTIDVSTPERTRIDAAFRALYLLPSAPRELIDAAYAALSNGGGASRELRAAYETIVATPDALPNGYKPPLRTSPWELLHVHPDAPQYVIAAAYDLWRGDAEPLVIRARKGKATVLVATFGSPPAREPSVDAGLTGGEQFVSTYVELLGDAEEIEQQPNVAEPSSPPPAGEGLGEGSDRPPTAEAFVSTYEELLDVTEQIKQQPNSHEPSSPLPAGEGPGEGSAPPPPTAEAFVYTYEELLDETLGSPPRVREGPERGPAPP